VAHAHTNYFRQMPVTRSKKSRDSGTSHCSSLSPSAGKVAAPAGTADTNRTQIPIAHKQKSRDSGTFSREQMPVTRSKKPRDSGTSHCSSLTPSAGKVPTSAGTAVVDVKNSVLGSIAAACP
jgi:hypothetical protein